MRHAGGKTRGGITSVIDAGGGFQNYPDDYRVIEKLRDAGEMLVFVFGVGRNHHNGPIPCAVFTAQRTNQADPVCMRSMRLSSVTSVPSAKKPTTLPSSSPSP